MVVDIGGGTTDVAVFSEGAIQYTSVIPVGGDQLTRSRLKKKKLQLKDEITEISNSLLPDIIA